MTISRQSDSIWTPHKKVAAPTVPFYPGDGTEIHLDISHLADFPRGQDGTCAFCHADSLAESSPEDSEIAKFYARNPKAETCPMCDGRPT